MARKKKPTYNFNDFFGNANQYHLLGAQTGESFFSFLATLEKYLGTDIRSIGEFEYLSKDFECQFQMAFAKIKEPCDISLIILENKSTLFNQKGYPTAKKERNLSFHTLSLFDEFCYILNSQGIYIHPWEHTDCDYLLMYYARKDINIISFSDFLSHIPKARSFSYPDLFADELPDKDKSAKRKFFEDIFCDAEIRIAQWEQNDMKRLLGNTKIPDNNLPEIYKLYEDITPVFTSEYIEYVRKDPSY
ncbi:MAG: hypothetical protein J5644_11205 [Bacteroidales bacterium]|nr:hypothetical protein [Bacteroidales bacterium]